MDINFLPNQSSDTNNPVSILKEGGKYGVIKEKLCTKRKTLEETLKNCSDTERDEIAIDLMRLKESMRTFGVTEIDYQAYLETTKGSV